MAVALSHSLIDIGQAIMECQGSRAKELLLMDGHLAGNW